MFNLGMLIQKASAAMAQKMIASDQMFNQYKVFCSQFGLDEPSRAEFDSLVSTFNQTSPADKLAQFHNLPADQLSKLAGLFGKSGQGNPPLF